MSETRRGPSESEPDKKLGLETGRAFKLNRRELLNLAMGASAATALAKLAEIGGRTIIERQKHEPEEVEEQEIGEELPELPEIPYNPKRCETETLAGRRFADLYTKYTNIKGTVPKTAYIDFDYQLHELWKQKERRSSYGKVVVQTGRRLRKEYREKPLHKVEIVSYIRQVEVAVGDVKKNFNWKVFGGIKKLRTEELEFVESIGKSVNAKDLLAYSLTELMPSADGKLNVKVLEFLLKNAGQEYVESIPAIYDPKTSFGPYQFTEFALYDHKGTRRGASIANRALPESKKIPGSVSKLRTVAHHKAAYLFMVDNIANLVHKIDWDKFDVLKKQLEKNKDDIIAYAATAHHGPAPANRYATKWLKDDAKKPYREYCGRVYKLYAQKTEANLKAIREIGKH